MAISPVSSGSSNIAALQSQSQSPQVREKEGDGDGDDGTNKVAATSVSQGATVNTSGQVVGSIINVQA